MNLSLRNICFLLLLLVIATSCQKETEYIYQVNDVNTLPQDVVKTTPKTNEQYISILYANLFQKALSADKLMEVVDLVESVGDKESVYEIIISSFMNDPSKIIPTNQEMRADPDAFIDETYARFLVRRPSEAEKTWFRNYIESNANITPEHVFISFALSNEYRFY